MSGLRETAERVAAMGRFPTTHADRATALEKASARLVALAAGSAHEAEPWDDFLRRIGVIA